MGNIAISTIEQRAAKVETVLETKSLEEFKKALQAETATMSHAEKVQFLESFQEKNKAAHERDNRVPTVPTKLDPKTDDVTVDFVQNSKEKLFGAGSRTISGPIGHPDASGSGAPEAAREVATGAHAVAPVDKAVQDTSVKALREATGLDTEKTVSYTVKQAGEAVEMERKIKEPADSQKILTILQDNCGTQAQGTEFEKNYNAQRAGKSTLLQDLESVLPREQLEQARDILQGRDKSDAARLHRLLGELDSGSGRSKEEIEGNLIQTMRGIRPGEMSQVRQDFEQWYGGAGLGAAVFGNPNLSPEAKKTLTTYLKDERTTGGERSPKGVGDLAVAAIQRGSIADLQAAFDHTSPQTRQMVAGRVQEEVENSSLSSYEKDLATDYIKYGEPSVATRVLDPGHKTGISGVFGKFDQEKIDETLKGLSDDQRKRYEEGKKAWEASPGTLTNADSPTKYPENVQYYLSARNAMASIGTPEQVGHWENLILRRHQQTPADAASGTKSGASESGASLLNSLDHCFRHRPHGFRSEMDSEEQPHPDQALGYLRQALAADPALRERLRNPKAEDKEFCQEFNTKFSRAVGGSAEYQQYAQAMIENGRLSVDQELQRSGGDFWSNRSDRLKEIISAPKEERESILKRLNDPAQKDFQERLLNGLDDNQKQALKHLLQSIGDDGRPSTASLLRSCAVGLGTSREEVVERMRNLKPEELARAQEQINKEYAKNYPGVNAIGEWLDAVGRDHPDLIARMGEKQRFFLEMEKYVKSRSGDSAMATDSTTRNYYETFNRYAALRNGGKVDPAEVEKGRELQDQYRDLYLNSKKERADRVANWALTGIGVVAAPFSGGMSLGALGAYAGLAYGIKTGSAVAFQGADADMSGKASANRMAQSVLDAAFLKVGPELLGFGKTAAGEAAQVTARELAGSLKMGAKEAEDLLARGSADLLEGSLKNGGAPLTDEVLMKLAQQVAKPGQEAAVLNVLKTNLAGALNQQAPEAASQMLKQYALRYGQDIGLGAGQGAVSSAVDAAFQWDPKKRPAENLQNILDAMEAGSKEGAKGAAVMAPIFHAVGSAVRSLRDHYREHSTKTQVPQAGEPTAAANEQRENHQPAEGEEQSVRQRSPEQIVLEARQQIANTIEERFKDTISDQGLRERLKEMTLKYWIDHGKSGNPTDLIENMSGQIVMSAYNRMMPPIGSLGTPENVAEAQAYFFKEAVKMERVFGKDWERFMNLPGRAHEAAERLKKTYSENDGKEKQKIEVPYMLTHWLPLGSKSELAGLSKFILSNADPVNLVTSQRLREGLEAVCKAYPHLDQATKNRAIEPEALKGQFRDQIVQEALAKTYKDCDPKHYNFGAECARWGIKPEDFSEYQRRYIASLSVPSPFPTDKTWTQGGFKAYFIRRDDPRGLFLGKYSNCCQHPSDSGAACAWHGQESPNSGFLVVEDRKGIIAQSWAWVSPDGGLCFDSIEGLSRKDSDYTSSSAAVAAQAKRHGRILDLYNQVAADLNNQFHTITVGKGVGAKTISTSEAFPTLLGADASLKPPVDGFNYKDSREQRLIIERRRSMLEKAVESLKAELRTRRGQQRP